ncbi:MAG TPA: DUF4058 family protein, partial [Gemmataceae bacterium]|nr:DUF4058 family protein [Gemmataceae bacterium]
YYLKTDEHVYIHELPEGNRGFFGKPDVFLDRSNSPRTGSGGAAVLPATNPRPVTLVAVDVERVPFVEIRDRRNRRLVTIIELLSPSNKNPGPDRDHYVNKRNRTLASPTNLVEIDLLRGGPRMPLAEKVGGDYGILVSRYTDRPKAEWYAVGLREPIPKVPVPMAEEHLPLVLDIQAVIHQLYDAGGYYKFMYESTPIPPLAADDDSWARGILANAGIAV